MFVRNLRFAVLGFGLILASLTAAGCGNSLRNEQLERVAKDWSLVIRASQVIPIYPLSEDLVPGDVFLVRMSIAQQHREYQERGFLPMDMHLTRLTGLDYAAGYLNSYGTGGRTNTPYHWQFPPDGTAPATLKDYRRSLANGAPRNATPPADSTPPAGNGSNQSEAKPPRHSSPTLWPTAPRAAFPSYTFEVDSRGGIKAALPIQGVPVAMSMMQTDKASGSVTLSDAYTYGVPYEKLIDKVNAWAEMPANQCLLKSIRAGVNRGNTWRSVFDDAGKALMLDKNERTVYLRVVSRVYVVGSVNVSLINTRAGAAEVQVGAVRNIELLNPALQAPATPKETNQSGASNGSGNAAAEPPAAEEQQEQEEEEEEEEEALAAGGSGAAGTPQVPNAKEVANNYQQALDAVNANLGGATKIQWATARSVALQEDFARPLVIGYLGFDFPVLQDGSLGPPIATQDQLEGAVVAAEEAPGKSGVTRFEYVEADDALRERVLRWLEADANNNTVLEDWLRQPPRNLDMISTVWVSAKATNAQLKDAICELRIPE